jgi:hypothetical protein
MLRLTSANRTCYLAAAFLTVLSLHCLETYPGENRKHAEVPQGDEVGEPGVAAMPPSVAEVLDLVQRMQRDSGATPRAPMLAPATTAISHELAGVLRTDIHRSE